MSEVLDIEVDGEIEDRAGQDAGGRSAQWGLPVAIALAGSLLLAVMVLVLLPAMTGSEGRTGPAAKPGAQPPAAPATVPPAPSVIPVDARISAARVALAAWGEFVADGDLERLKPWFAEDGPQYRQLAEEAGGLAATEGDSGSYEVMLREASVVHQGQDEAVVGGKVTWARPLETGQEYAWEVVLRRAEGNRWLLWTVREG
jgi:hypothetical protein